MAYKLRWETGYLNGAPFKVGIIFAFFKLSDNILILD